MPTAFVAVTLTAVIIAEPGNSKIHSAARVLRPRTGALKVTLAPCRPRREVYANITLVTLKVGDTLDSLMRRVVDSPAVAAE